MREARRGRVARGAAEVGGGVIVTCWLCVKTPRLACAYACVHAILVGLDPSGENERPREKLSPERRSFEGRLPCHKSTERSGTPPTPPRKVGPRPKEHSSIVLFVTRATVRVSFCVQHQQRALAWYTLPSSPRDSARASSPSRRGPRRRRRPRRPRGWPWGCAKVLAKGCWMQRLTCKL